MKKFILMVIVVLFAYQLNANIWNPISSQTPIKAKTTLISQEDDNIIISFELGGYYLNSVKTPRGSANIVSVPGGTPILEEGQPDLPKLSTSVIIPDLALMDIEVISSSYVDYQNVEIAPSKGNITRDINPNDVPYTYASSYETNSFFPGRQAQLNNPFIMRDVRGQSVIVYPFQYNPVTKVLRVFSDIQVRVFKINNNGYNPLIRKNNDSKISSNFYEIYQRAFINNPPTDYTALEEEGKMLIISHANYLSAMQPLVDWKTIKGMEVEMVDVSTIGANASAIKTYVQNYYNTNGLTFLLLVGDAPQIPTNSGSGLSGDSDQAYGYIVGNDHNADIFVGRFSAENVEHATTMVNRTIEYEKNPDTSKDWFSKGMGIASQEGPGDDGEDDYQHIRNIRTDLMNYTYTGVSEKYEGSQGGEDAPGNPTPTMVADDINAGLSIITYCGHGSETSWVSSGFSNSNIQSLTNNKMYPFIWSVACVNGNFVNQTCFAEAWTRAKNSNGPTGAVATLMSTINQAWNPPMEGQDEMVDILVESYSNNIKRTFGALSLNGIFKMIETYGSNGIKEADTWTVFGDPSVVVRTKMPVNITATHPSQLFMGESSITVSTAVNGATVAISCNNELLGSAKVTAGNAVINFEPFTIPDTLTIVITAYNHIPYITQIPIIPNNGPYLIYNDVKVNDANGNANNKADYGEKISLDLTLVNIGVLPSEQTTITINSNDQYITINDSVSTGNAFLANDTLTIANQFEIDIHTNIPDLHQIPFTYTATNGTESWSGTFNIQAHSGKLNYVTYTINDSQNGNNNGFLNAGEEVILNITLNNIGSSKVFNAFNQISISDDYVTVVDSLVRHYGDFNVPQVITKKYKIKANNNTPLGHMIQVDMLATAELDYSSRASFMLPVGQVPVAIIDLDGNKNSGPAIKNALAANNIQPLYLTAMPNDLSNYQTLFVCLGVAPDKHVLTNAQGQLLAGFLDNGGKLYMEGGDTWKKDPQTAVHPKFKIVGVVDGSGDLATQIGEPTSFANGLSLEYDGDNMSIDHIVSFGTTSFNLFKNSAPLYFSAVGNEDPTYKTLASAFEFGGIKDTDAINNKTEYMRRIVEFLGINSIVYTANFVGTPIYVPVGTTVSYTDFSSAGTTSWNWTFESGSPATSTEQSPVVTYNTEGEYNVTLIISNGTELDTLIKENYIKVIDFTDVDKTLANIVLYPNPVQDVLKINFNQTANFATVQISDMNRRLVYNKTGISTDSLFELDVRNFANGVYFATMVIDNKVANLKFVVKK